MSNDHFLCPITQEVMTDPVIGSDGITYERSAIAAWFAAGHSTSPLTRQPMVSQSLVPNIALRSMIQDAQRASPPAAAAGGAAGGAGVADPAPVVAAPTLSAARTPGGDVVIQIKEADGVAALPTIFIDVLDISGSMGNAAAEPSRNAEAAAFSRADLVRHSVATQIELLRPTDQLGIVLFDHGVTEALPPMAMNASGRTAAKSVLPLIRPQGGTNIWTGIQRGLAMAERALSAAGSTPHNVVLIVQTDGESDPSYNPPRGIVGTFRAWLDAHPGVRLTVHTVGYGYGRSLDMPLLREIADAGGGTVNYIADGSMVGTVFIHLLANLMSCAHTGLVLQIPDIGFVDRVGFLQVGQKRHIHVPAAAVAALAGESKAYLKNSAGEVIAEVSVPLADPTCVVTDADFTETAFGICRQSFIHTVTDMLHACEAHTSGTAWPSLAEFDALHMELAASQHRDARITALLSDLDDTDPAKGQISKAFASADAFGRWGRHYIPWVLSGHQYEWAINFRDESSLHAYGTPATRALVTRGDEIFLTLPQPTASCQARAAVYGGAPLVAPSLAAVHSSVGPCFLPASTVLMADGTKKRCDQIQPGDIAAPNYRVRCVIKTEVPHADIVQIGIHGPHEDVGGFTMWHPVYVNSEWRHPADLGEVKRVATDAIYNFVLDKGHVILLNGVMTCTMGHEMTANAVIDHPYFGKRRPGVRNIIDDLSASPGWESGYVVWRNVIMEKDPVTGLITRLVPGI
jgi:Mg-chelatase subunit ChlD